MNKVKKILALVCCAVLLVCISVGATLAYLVSQTENVKNTFTVGNIKITLDEADVNEEGQPLDKDGKVIENFDYDKDLDKTVRVLENEYKLMPGHTYVKDPTVHVAKDSEESYIRMMVTISHISELKAIFGATGEYFMPENFVGDTWDSSIWPCHNITNNEDNTATYEFRYYTTFSTEDDTVDADLEPLFTEVVVPGTVTNDQLATLADMEINVIAHAIQADNMTDANTAWAAFDEQMAGK